MSHLTVARLGVIAVLLILAAAAFAHDVDGNPNWITSGKYQGPDGIHCCGPADCEELSPDEVKVTPKGYFLIRFQETVPFSEGTPSEDKRYWRCHKASGERRCFFAPIGGS